jgi:glycerate kinase
MRILLASDKFKGALPSPEVAAALRHALAEVFPGAEFDTCPIADGGEGTTEAMVGALGGVWAEAAVTDAQGRPRTARFGWVPAERRAILEMSAASGLALVSDRPLDPTTASTGGTGELLRAAHKLGAERILLGIGGSATNDGGLGMALALGHRFERRGAPFVPTLATLPEADRLRLAARRASTDRRRACATSHGSRRVSATSRIWRRRRPARTRGRRRARARRAGSASA